MNSKPLRLIAAVIVFSVCASAAPVFPAQTEGDFTIKDFHFNSGEVLPALRLHYVTLGTPHRNSSGEIDNAVLLLHSTGSDTTEFFESLFSGPLYGSGQPLDLSKFYLVIPDAIGHGKSSKPSDGLRGHFPHYGYEDIVAAQRRLLTEKLGVTHLRLVLGLSMGGMQTWLWGERYPISAATSFAEVGSGVPSASAFVGERRRSSKYDRYSPAGVLLPSPLLCFPAGMIAYLPFFTRGISRSSAANSGELM